MNLERQRVVIAGGSGFIGRAVTAALLSQGQEVVILTRSPKGRGDQVKEVAWDGATAGVWREELSGAAAIINLTGKSIDCPHTPENRREIIESRVRSVQAIAQAVSQLAVPPRVWVQASATGFYGDTGDRACEETAPNGQGFLAEVCRGWEGAIAGRDLRSTRWVTLRIGFVLGDGGGAFPVLGRLTKLFLGGAAGSGRQYVSWIHLQDLAAIFTEAVRQDSWRGVFNATAPEPVTNAEFMRALRQVMHRPWSPPAPALAVRIGARIMGSEGSLALVSQRCPPARLQQSGFRFQFPQLRLALENLAGTRR